MAKSYFNKFNRDFKKSMYTSIYLPICFCNSFYCNSNSKFW